MKVVVAATRQPHALSRQQVEAVFTILPTDLKAGITEVWLETSPWLHGRCEFDEAGGRVRICLVVPEKTPATTEKALRLLLECLARRADLAPFFERRPRPSPSAEEVIRTWLPECIAAAS